jgi:hypothetical protein
MFAVVMDLILMIWEFALTAVLLFVERTAEAAQGCYESIAPSAGSQRVMLILDLPHLAEGISFNGILIEILRI